MSAAEPLVSTGDAGEIAFITSSRFRRADAGSTLPAQPHSSDAMEVKQPPPGRRKAIWKAVPTGAFG